MTAKRNERDIVEQLRRPGGMHADDLIELCHAATEIENLRTLLDQAGVTIAQGMLNGLPPLPWRGQPSHGRRVTLVDRDGRKIGALWLMPRVTATTILALVNQPAAQAVKMKITEVAKGAEDEQRKYRGSGPAGDGGPFDCGGAWGGD